MKHIEDYAATFTKDCYMGHLSNGRIEVATGSEVTYYDDEQKACEEWERLLKEWSY